MTDVIMPKMGESITEGTILEWKKVVGDNIQKDETLLEISTDKVDSEVPSPASGIVVEILAKVNDTVSVGEVIARIGNSLDEKKDEDNNKLKNNIKKEQNTNTEKDSVKLERIVEKNENVKNDEFKSTQKFYSPLVKSIASAENISLEELDLIKGSGKEGRVNKSDVLHYLTDRSEKSAVIDSKPILDSESSVILSNKIEPMSRMRKKIAEHMIDSVKTSPHVYTTVEADVTNLVKIRQEYKNDFKNRSGVSLTYTPMLIDATIRAIQEFPLINTSINEDNIVHHQNINMGVAVALPDDNLIVPVIHSSEEKNFLGLARSTVDLASRSRDNTLNPDEIFGSTFTITNPGIFGGLFGMGIINQPNVGILAVGSFQKRPVVKETEYGDTIVVRHMVYLTLSYDHRIIDGAYGTKFLARLVDIIESYNENKILT